MTTTNSTALTSKRKADTALMPPPPPRPTKIKRPSTVLPEEEYLEGVSHIIRRDFFPGLAENRLKHEFLTALESKDDIWIKDVGQRLAVNAQSDTPGGRRGTSMPNATPYGWAGCTPVLLKNGTPHRTDDEPYDHVVREKFNMSLSSFQSKYTSEDNESFNALLDKQNIKNREKHAHLWSGTNKIPSARQIAYHSRQARLAELVNASTEMVSFQGRDRPAMPAYRVSAPRNSLMFQPGSVEDTHVTVAQEAEAKSNAPPKAIVYGNTRIATPALEYSQIPPSPSMSAIDDAIAGRPRPTESEVGSETPRVAGYAFIDAEPTLSELRAVGQAEPAFDHMALLSHLGKSDVTPNPFNIKEAEKREQLHHGLVEKNLRKKRYAPAPLHATRSLSTPKTTSRLQHTPASLTPAGRDLLDRVRRRTVSRVQNNPQVMPPTPNIPGRKEKRAQRTPAATPRATF